MSADLPPPAPPGSPSVAPAFPSPRRPRPKSGAHAEKALTAVFVRNARRAATPTVTACRLTDWGRIAIRYDRCADLLLSACALAAVALFWL